MPPRVRAARATRSRAGLSITCNEPFGFKLPSGWQAARFQVAPGPPGDAIKSRRHDHVACAMICAMSDSRDVDPANGRDVMSNLPTTRPQRRSSKRGAAGAGTSGKAPARSAPAKGSGRGPAPARPGPSSGPRKRAKPTSGRGASERRKPAAVRPSAATQRVKQSDARKREAPGPRVAPGRKGVAPSGTALVSTTLQAAGELAQLGVSLGARMLRGAASRIPRP